ncbi:MAG: hypothetical protein LBQ80_00845 [Clostridium sp.]|jgi:Na+-translocating ferredoxin:NAD+ oxidoreductase RnfE subunit|nr:hypothetical protein [Clostridium sp.]
MPEASMSFKERLKLSALARNPVLIQMLAICVLMAAGTLKAALVLAGSLCIIFTVTQTMANLFMRHWPRYFRMTAYAAIGTLCAFGITLLMLRLDPGFTSELGMYLSILAVSSITAFHCEKNAIYVTLKESLTETAARLIGFCPVLLLCGALRELLGSGTLWEHTLIKGGGLAFFAHPAGALVLLGFGAALLRILVHRYGWAYVKEVAMRVSETTIVPVAQEDEPKDEPDENQALPEGDEGDEIPRPVGYFAPEKPAAPDESIQGITAAPSRLEDTQQSFDELMAELRRRYLEDEKGE